MGGEQSDPEPRSPAEDVTREPRPLVARAVRWVAVGIAFAAMLILILSYFVRVQAPSVGIKPPPSAQDIYKAMLRRDQQSFDRGLLAYSPIGTLKTGASADFEVIVVNVGRGPERTIVTKVDGLLVYQQDVPTGGIVSVEAVRCQNVTCDSESSPAQPVLLLGYRAIWLWQITAGTPGPAEIILRADTYDQDSQQTLSEEIIPVTGKVVPTAAFNQQQSHKKIANLTKSGVDLIVTIGSVATAIVAVGGLIGWLVMKRRRGKRGIQGRTSRTPKRKAASSSRTRGASKQRS